jgi:hypothetical protein
MKCPNDSQIQALADNEADADVRAHAAGCERCAGRLRDRQQQLGTLERALTEAAPVHADALRRIEQRLEGAGARGATRLRDAAPAASLWRRTAWGGAAVAAATLVAVLFIVPLIKGPSSVSAAEILAASASRLAQPVQWGVEILEYELVLDGMPRDLMPDHANGAYRIAQIIDHSQTGRFRYTSYEPNGRIHSSIAQDPAGRRRVSFIRVDDQPFRFDFLMAEATPPSLPELERLHMEASVALMQASGHQLLQVVEGTSGTQYRIEVPQVNDSTVNALWDLTHAQIVVDAHDYRIHEFSVSGTFLKQPYSVSYRLINREVKAPGTVPAAAFAIDEEPGTIAIEGDATAIPLRDVVVGALRELARARQGR